MDPRARAASSNCAPIQFRRVIRAGVAKVVDARELVPGDTVVVTSTVLALGTSSLRFRHAMSDTATGAVAAEMELVGVFVDLATRKSTPVWPELRAKAEALLAAPGERAA